jgi:hypothetical protein
LPNELVFTLVDVGAGAGLLGVYLAKDRPLARYRFVEPIESLERHLEQQFGREANFRDRRKFEGAKYVALLDVLEHQEDDRSFLRALVDQMDPGALLLVTVPAISRLWSQWDVDLEHKRRYTKLSLRRCFEGLPVEIRSIDYLFPEMFLPALFRARSRPARSDSGSPDSALFPDIPGWLNELLYAIGRLSLIGRRWWPIGTSLTAVVARARA